MSNESLREQIRYQYSEIFYLGHDLITIIVFLLDSSMDQKQKKSLIEPLTDSIKKLLRKYCNSHDQISLSLENNIKKLLKEYCNSHDQMILSLENISRDQLLDPIQKGINEMHPEMKLIFKIGYIISICLYMVNSVESMPKELEKFLSQFNIPIKNHKKIIELIEEDTKNKIRKGEKSFENEFKDLENLLLEPLGICYKCINLKKENIGEKGVFLSCSFQNYNFEYHKTNCLNFSKVSGIILQHKFYKLNLLLSIISLIISIIALLFSIIINLYF